MKNLFQSCLVAIFSLSAVAGFAQKDLSDGKIMYEITELNSDNPQAAMLKGSTISMFFQDEKQKMDINMMGGMVRVQTITNTDAPEESTVLMDMMGQKIELEDAGSSFQEKFGQAMMAAPAEAEGNAEKPYTITYDKKDKKDIAGYKCRKAVITPKDGPAVTMYVTDKINPLGNQFKQMFEDLNGFPLQIMVNAEGVEVTLTATEIKENIDASNFAVPAGYQKMTMDDFSKQMGGMMQMGG